MTPVKARYILYMAVGLLLVYGHNLITVYIGHSNSQRLFTQITYAERRHILHDSHQLNTTCYVNRYFRDFLPKATEVGEQNFTVTER